jgi:L-seryl-tRNA(Ser) seleniumtransferase
MHRILEHPDVAKYEPELGRESIKRAVEKILDRARASETPSYDALVAEVSAKLEELCRHGLQPVINATGIIVHTNLGRAPLAGAAIDAVAQIARGYSNLEYDLNSGERGSRYDRVRTILIAVTGAEDSLIVNNCAAAVLLVLDTLAKGREVIVGRNQLIEIGGGFRIPEILERSGARLVEVGTTNRAYIEDYERARIRQTIGSKGLRRTPMRRSWRSLDGAPECRLLKISAAARLWISALTAWNESGPCKMRLRTE